MIEYIMGAFILVWLVVGNIVFFSDYYKEKHMWNNGYCAETGLKWVYFDQVACGTRYYWSGPYFCWVNWDRIDGWGKKV